MVTYVRSLCYPGIPAYLCWEDHENCHNGSGAVGLADSICVTACISSQNVEELVRTNGTESGSLHVFTFPHLFCYCVRRVIGFCFPSYWSFRKKYIVRSCCTASWAVSSSSSRTQVVITMSSVYPKYFIPGMLGSSVSAEDSWLFGSLPDVDWQLLNKRCSQMPHKLPGHCGGEELPSVLSLTLSTPPGTSSPASKRRRLHYQHCKQRGD